MAELSMSLTDLTWVKLLIWATGIALLLWLCVRSRSLHMVLDLVWRVLHGRRQAETREMRAFYRERTALMHFRWVTSIPARTLREAEALVAWCHEYDEEIADVHACGHYFDHTQPGLRVAAAGIPRHVVKAQGSSKLPGRAAQAVLCLGVAAFCWVICMAVIAACFNGAIVSVKGGSGTQLVLYPNHFSPLFKLSASFSTADCKTPKAVAAASGLPLAEAGVACNWLSSAGRESFVAKTVFVQRTAALTLAAVLAWLAYSGIFLLLAMRATANMQRRLAARESAAMTSADSSNNSTR